MSDETGNNPEFDEFMWHLMQSFNCMLQDGAKGEIIVFERVDGSLVSKKIDAKMLLDEDRHNKYEMILFDGGNTHGNAWKHVFFPHQIKHFFVDETEPQKGNE